MFHILMREIISTGWTRSRSSVGALYSRSKPIAFKIGGEITKAKPYAARGLI